MKVSAPYRPCPLPVLSSEAPPRTTPTHSRRARVDTATDIAPLARAWVEGWVVSRSAAPPVDESWGFTIDVGLVPHVRRYVLMPDADEARFRKLMDPVTAPGTWIKLFLPPETVEPWLAPGWSFDTPGFLMSTGLGRVPDPDVPAGYVLRQWTRGGLTRVLLTTEDGHFAARGQIAVPAVGAPGVVDQIETSPAHQRRGLGSVVMRTLGNAAADAGSSSAVLGATLDGQALYHHLGWTTHAPLTGLVFGGA